MWGCFRLWRSPRRKTRPPDLAAQGVAGATGSASLDREARTPIAPAESLSAGPGTGEPTQPHAQLLVRVWHVQGLASLHPRLLDSLLPSLISLGSGSASAAVERHWQQQQAEEPGSLFFLQPITATASAGTVLGCAPTPAACGAALTHQLQQQQQQHSSQPASEAPLQHTNLASALQAVGSHVLSCASSASTQAPSLPVVHSSSSNTHTPSLLSSSDSSAATNALCLGSLSAAVLPAYHAAPGGVLEPALVLEFRSTAPAAQVHTDSQHQKCHQHLAAKPRGLQQSSAAYSGAGQQHLMGGEAGSAAAGLRDPQVHSTGAHNDQPHSQHHEHEQLPSAPESPAQKQAGINFRDIVRKALLAGGSQLAAPRQAGARTSLDLLFPSKGTHKSVFGIHSLHPQLSEWSPRDSPSGKEEEGQARQRQASPGRLSHNRSLSGCLVQANQDLKLALSARVRLRRSHTGGADWDEQNGGATRSSQHGAHKDGCGQLPSRESAQAPLDPERKQQSRCPSVQGSRRSSESQMEPHSSSSVSKGRLMPVLMRAMAVLNEVPVIATLAELESGCVVYQNQASRAYWGPLEKPQRSQAQSQHTSRHSSRFSSCPSSNGAGACNLDALLDILLPHNNEDILHEMLEEVGAGKMWSKVLIMPQQDAARTITASHMRRGTPLTSSSSAGCASVGSGRDGLDGLWKSKSWRSASITPMASRLQSTSQIGTSASQAPGLGALEGVLEEAKEGSSGSDKGSGASLQAQHQQLQQLLQQDQGLTETSARTRVSQGTTRQHSAAAQQQAAEPPVRRKPRRNVTFCVAPSWCKQPQEELCHAPSKHPRRASSGSIPSSLANAVGQQRLASVQVPHCDGGRQGSWLMLHDQGLMVVGESHGGGARGKPSPTSVDAAGSGSDIAQERVGQERGVRAEQRQASTDLQQQLLLPCPPAPACKQADMAGDLPVEQQPVVRARKSASFAVVPAAGSSVDACTGTAAEMGTARQSSTRDATADAGLKSSGSGPGAGAELHSGSGVHSGSSASISQGFAREPSRARTDNHAITRPLRLQIPERTPSADLPAGHSQLAKAFKSTSSDLHGLPTLKATQLAQSARRRSSYIPRADSSSPIAGASPKDPGPKVGSPQVRLSLAVEPSNKLLSLMQSTPSLSVDEVRAGLYSKASSTNKMPPCSPPDQTQHERMKVNRNRSFSDMRVRLEDLQSKAATAGIDTEVGKRLAQAAKLLRSPRSAQPNAPAHASTTPPYPIHSTVAHAEDGVHRSFSAGAMREVQHVEEQQMVTRGGSMDRGTRHQSFSRYRPHSEHTEGGSSNREPVHTLPEEGSPAHASPSTPSSKTPIVSMSAWASGQLAAEVQGSGSGQQQQQQVLQDPHTQDLDAGRDSQPAAAAPAAAAAPSLREDRLHAGFCSASVPLQSREHVSPFQASKGDWKPFALLHASSSRGASAASSMSGKGGSSPAPSRTALPGPAMPLSAPTQNTPVHSAHAWRARESVLSEMREEHEHAVAAEADDAADADDEAADLPRRETSAGPARVSSSRPSTDAGAVEPAHKGFCWHEVQAMAITDPVSGRAALLLLQTDITQRAELEARMAALTESQLSMLEQMFPRHVLECMVAQQPNQATDTATTASHLASSHEDVTILFTDIVGFTSMSKQVKPDHVMAYLNELFTAFDELVDTYQIYKVETAGDCYIAAGGLMMIDKDGFMCIDPSPDPKEAAQRVLSFAKALLHCAKTVAMPHNGEPTTIRVGMHTGPAVTGLIGTKLPKFSVFGDTMNTCSRMESTCRYGCIQISETTNALLQDPGFKPTGGVEVKGKGLMQTFIWDPTEQKPEVAVPPDVAQAVSRIKKHANESPAKSGPLELLPLLPHLQPSLHTEGDGTLTSTCHATSPCIPRLMGTDAHASAMSLLSTDSMRIRDSLQSVLLAMGEQSRGSPTEPTRQLHANAPSDGTAAASPRATPPTAMSSARHASLPTSSTMRFHRLLPAASLFAPSGSAASQFNSAPLPPLLYHTQRASCAGGSSPQESGLLFGAEGLHWSPFLAHHHQQQQQQQHATPCNPEHAPASALLWCGADSGLAGASSMFHTATQTEGDFGSRSDPILSARHGELLQQQAAGGEGPPTQETVGGQSTDSAVGEGASGQGTKQRVRVARSKQWLHHLRASLQAHGLHSRHQQQQQ